MGSPLAFEYHKKYLAYKKFLNSKDNNKQNFEKYLETVEINDEDVVLDYLKHLNPVANGLILQFLALNNIILRFDNLIFVHGAINDDNYK